MPSGRNYNYKTTRNAQTRPPGKKTELKPKEETEEKKTKEVVKRGEVSEEVEQRHRTYRRKLNGKDMKSATQHEKTNETQRTKGKKIGTDQSVEVRIEKKADEVQKSGTQPQIKKELTKGSVHNASDEVARAKGKELLYLLQSGLKIENVITQKNGDAEESLKGEHEANPDQIVIRRKTLHIQSLEKKISNIQSTLTMPSMKSGRSILFRKKRQLPVQSRKEWNEERQSLVAQITERDEALWKERSIRFTLEQEKSMFQDGYSSERQSLVAQIAARDEALIKMKLERFNLEQEKMMIEDSHSSELQSLIAQIEVRDKELEKKREDLCTLEQDKYLLECRYNALASHTDYDETYMEEKVRRLENELNQQARAKEALDAEILIMKEKLEMFEQEKEDWDKRKMDEKEKRLSNAAQTRQISAQCRNSRRGDILKNEFKKFEEKMKSYEKDIEANEHAIEPKLATFETIKIFAHYKKIFELAEEVSPIVVQILDENDVNNVDTSMVLGFVRRSLIQDEDMTPEAMSARIVELREYREFKPVPPRSAPIQPSSSSSRPPLPSPQSKQPVKNVPFNATNSRQPSSRRTNQPAPSVTSCNSSNTATRKEQQRKQTKKWNTSNKIREVNISERTCVICLDSIGDRPTRQCEVLSCREPLHEDCINAQWRAGIQICPTCKGPMPDRSDFPAL